MKTCSLLLLCCFHAFHVSSQVNAGPDKGICLNCGGSTDGVIIGSLTSNPSSCYSWKASPDDPSIVNANTPTITVRPSQTTTYTLTVCGQNFSTVNSATVKVFVFNVNLNEVTFSDNDQVIMKDNGSGKYAPPHWKLGAISSPVYYKSGVSMKLSAKIGLNEDPGLGSTLKIKVRGKGSGGYDIDANSVTRTGTEIALVSTPVLNAFPPAQVDFFDPFEMQWEISFDDGNKWCPVGTSKNQLYVTFKQPINDARTPNLFHTVLHLGCMNAKGKKTQDEVFTKIWEDFTDRDVRRADGTQLSYYKSFTVASPRYVKDATANLLKNTDGQCSSWACLLLDILKAQGIQETNNYVTTTYPLGNGFLVKNWEFIGAGKSGIPAFPYLNIDRNPYTTPTSYSWFFEEVKDVAGTPAQGTLNPASFFNNHQFTMYGGKFYDPSYGTQANTIAEMENNTIAGFYLRDYVIVSEAKYNADLNGNGNKTDTFLKWVFTLKKNATGQDLRPRQISH